MRLPFMCSRPAASTRSASRISPLLPKSVAPTRQRGAEVSTVAAAASPKISAVYGSVGSTIFEYGSVVISRPVVWPCTCMNERAIASP